MILSPQQMLCGRTDWFLRWDRSRRQFMPVDTASLVFQMAQRKPNEAVVRQQTLLEEAAQQYDWYEK